MAKTLALLAISITLTLGVGCSHSADGDSWAAYDAHRKQVSDCQDKHTEELRKRVAELRKGHNTESQTEWEAAMKLRLGAEGCLAILQKYGEISQ
jgi:hypothetical protein